MNKLKRFVNYWKKNNNTMREIATLTNTTYNFAVSIKTHKAHNDISNKYNIDNYTVKQPITDKSKYYNRNHAVSFDDNKLHTVCKLLSENELTVKEIAILTGLSKSTVYKIKHKDFKLKHYKDIMNLYNYNTYNKR